MTFGGLHSGHPRGVETQGGGGGVTLPWRTLYRERNCRVISLHVSYSGQYRWFEFILSYILNLWYRDETTSLCVFSNHEVDSSELWNGRLWWITHPIYSQTVRHTVRRGSEPERRLRGPQQYKLILYMQYVTASIGRVICFQQPYSSTSHALPIPSYHHYFVWRSSCLNWACCTHCKFPWICCLLVTMKIAYKWYLEDMTSLSYNLPVFFWKNKWQYFTAEKNYFANFYETLLPDALWIPLVTCIVLSCHKMKG